MILFSGFLRLKCPGKEEKGPDKMRAIGTAAFGLFLMKVQMKTDANFPKAE